MNAHPALLRRKPRWRTAPRRRGSTLLIVLGVLSVMVLLVVALTYTSKLEIQSARNFGDNIQFRMAAATGVPAALRAAQDTLPPGPLGPLDLTLDPQFLARRPGALADASLVAATNDFERRLRGPNRLLALDWSALPRQYENHITPGETTAQLGDLANANLDRIAADPLLRNALAQSSLADASARVNINTAPAAILARVLAAAAERAGESVDASALAERIVSHRFGPDGQPGTAGVDDDLDDGIVMPPPEIVQAALDTHGIARGTVRSLRQPLDPASRRPSQDLLRRHAAAKAFTLGVDEADEYIADIRRPAFGDDRRWESVQELLTIDGVTPKLLAEAAPFLTAFSISQEYWYDGLEARPPLDLNRASVEEIHEALKQAYADSPRPDALLRQFAANIVDARDPDRVPTRFAGPNGTTILGFERTPLLTEVYVHVQEITEPTSDGQFLELYNPWPETFDLSGWTLRGAGGTIALSGSLPPGGYLILTNDKDNSREENLQRLAQGEGSLYDIFGVVNAGPSRRVAEAPQLVFSRKPGRYSVELFSRDGDLVDVFSYTVVEDAAGTSSYQRLNPIVRTATKRSATPFALLRDADAPPREFLSFLGQCPPDAPFTSVTDLFEVFQGYAASADSGVRWAFPSLGIPGEPIMLHKPATMPAPEELLDARIIDLFTVEANRRRTADAVERNLTDGDGDGELNGLKRPSLAADFREDPLDRKLAEEPTEQLLWIRYGESPLGLRQGLINVNTAPPEVLAAMPGMDPQTVHSFAAIRTNRMLRAQQGHSMDGLLYRRFSEVLEDFAAARQRGETGASLLARFREFHSAATLGSSSFILVGEALQTAESDVPNKAAERVELTVATDRPVPDTVSMRVLR